MKTFSRYVSLLLFICIGIGTTSCSPRLHNQSAGGAEIVTTDTVSQQFNLQLDFMKHHFSGMLIARRMTDDEVRLLFTSYFGLSIFDFSLRGDSLHVNSCIEPMRKKNLLRILEHDFKQVFLPNQPVRIKEKSAIFERRTSGKGMGKTIISLSQFSGSQPQRIQIKHPWIRLKIQLDKLEPNNP
ncbi:hypothetical protein [Bacteroides sp. 51]|uniref:hypothetical protein n=1 Tax=Bacteroides sp. 51 TaxID=2302938 RepID=UPI0013D5F78C|nr:hypothetical protein [Bacteroides sp. 51]NDV81070.1 hypothetical protein [Bacteroides sp. 51]